jgi:hypothetical protein
MCFVFRVAAFVAACLVVTGCASTQLNYNTLDLAGTVDKLILSQVLYNLTKFKDDPGALPAQVGLSAGTATTTLTLTPSFTGLPLASSSTSTNTVTMAAATTVANANAFTRAAASLGASGTDTGTQTWTLDPVTDPGDMSRLRALYRYATDDSYSPQNLFDDYPVQIAQTAQQGNGKPPIQYADQSFLIYPSCVKCLVSTLPKGSIPPPIVPPIILHPPGLPPITIPIPHWSLPCSDIPLADSSGNTVKQTVCLNPKLLTMKLLSARGYGWLLWDQQAPNNDYVEYVAFGRRQVAVNRVALTDFTLFVLNATSASTSNTSNGKALKFFIVNPR